MMSIDLEDLSNYDFLMNEKFKLNVTSNNKNYELLLYLKYNCDKIICMSQSEDLKVDTSTICYDTSSSDENYLKDIGEVILKIAILLNLDAEKIFFYGNSEDGFISIQLATIIKNSTAIADAPHYFNLNEIMLKNDYIPKAVILFNFDDNQFLEFSKRLNEISTISNKNSMKFILKSHQLTGSETVTLLNGIASGNMMGYIDDENSEVIRQNIELKKQNKELKEILVKWGNDTYSSFEKLEAKQKEIDDVLNSNSWKITKPLRKVVHLFKGD